MITKRVSVHLPSHFELKKFQETQENEHLPFITCPKFNRPLEIHPIVILIGTISGRLRMDRIALGADGIQKLHTAG